ncbi:MAG: hypothetical protein FD120_2832, partial [Gammaproteobacteria bacterium]
LTQYSDWVVDNTRGSAHVSTSTTTLATSSAAPVLKAEPLDSSKMPPPIAIPERRSDPAGDLNNNPFRLRAAAFGGSVLDQAKQCTAAEMMQAMQANRVRSATSSSTTSIDMFHTPTAVISETRSDLPPVRDPIRSRERADDERATICGGVEVGRNER